MQRTARFSPIQQSGNRRKGYAITMAQTVNPGAEVLIDDKSEG
jgi:hypothetical protein